MTYLCHKIWYRIRLKALSISRSFCNFVERMLIKKVDFPQAELSQDLGLSRLCCCMSLTSCIVTPCRLVNNYKYFEGV
jgi:hypothetical protein